MALLKIIKLAEGVWKHNSDLDGDFALTRLYAKMEFGQFLIVEAYGAKRRKYAINEIEVYDIGGVAETFANFDDLQIRLKALNYIGYDASFSSSGVESVTGDSVDNTDPLNPIVNAVPLSGTVNPISGELQINDLTPLTWLGDGVITASELTINATSQVKIVCDASSKGIVSELDYSENITDFDYTQKIYVDGSVQRTTLTSGSFTPTATPSDLIMIHEAGATATLTINMPTVPRDKQKVTIISVGGITALTLSTAVGSILNNITTLVAGGSARFVWLASESKWYKI
jgi:hypothetical protein